MFDYILIVPYCQPYLPLPSTPNWRPVTGTPAAFTPGSKFQLSSSDTPSEAAKLVQEQNLHFAFGDFDDHLEDVTIGKSYLRRDPVRKR